ncbi:hypothetical protein ACSNOK_34830, partial [Streptomyces sp. URMC 126]|uniref:hypothetical protein n=1 Tax=Streptomyces sp. URMC 126 TaxID=3423401 RepID=UPI003F1B5E79
LQTPAEPEAAAAAIELARLAGVLPALWLVETDASITLAPADVGEAARSRRAEIVARARLPVGGLDDTQMAVFRAPADCSEHVALLI